MSKVAPSLRNISWIPRRSGDFMQGENREEGKVIQIRGWHRQSDRTKLRRLREIAKLYGADPHLRWFVVNKILRPAGVQQRDYEGQCRAMLRWVQSNVYYTNEPDEQIQSPWRTIKVGTGDCDDSALLLAAMAHSIRMPWRFVLAGKKGGKPYRHVEGMRIPWGAKFHHIYMQLGWPPFKPKQWKFAEQTMRGAPLGTDIAMQGPGSMPELGISSPLSSKGMLGSLVVGSQYGNTEDVQPIADVRERERKLPVLADIVVNLPWEEIVFGVIQGTLTALAITWATDRLARRRR